MKRTRARRSPRQAEQALTLLEVMVVVLIMGMIAAIVSKVVVDRVDEARVETAKTQIVEFRDAFDMFFIQNGFYPATEQGLQALVTQPTSGRVPTKWPESGYIKAIPLDPWGQEYIYISPGSRDKFEIVCLGRDGAEGGEGFDADINSWEIGAAKQP